MLGSGEFVMLLLRVRSRISEWALRRYDLFGLEVVVGFPFFLLLFRFAMSRHLHRFSKVKTFRKAQETDSQSHFEGICPNDHWTIQLKKIAQVTRRVKRSAVKPLTVCAALPVTCAPERGVHAQDQ